MDGHVNELIKGARQEGNVGFAREVDNLSLVERNHALAAFAKMANENAAANAALPAIDLERSDGGNVTAVNVRSGKQVENAWSEGFVQKTARFIAEHDGSATAAKAADDAVGN